MPSKEILSNLFVSFPYKIRKPLLLKSGFLDLLYPFSKAIEPSFEGLQQRDEKLRLLNDKLALVEPMQN
jgi:hypothetical protein